jgi:hypothetical protein
MATAIANVFGTSQPAFQRGGGGVHMHVARYNTQDLRNQCQNHATQMLAQANMLQRVDRGGGYLKVGAKHVNKSNHSQLRQLHIAVASKSRQEVVKLTRKGQNSKRQKMGELVLFCDQSVNPKEHARSRVQQKRRLDNPADDIFHFPNF